MPKDPVCGMEIDAEDAAVSAEYEGVTYRFCSQACGERFAANPGAFVDGEEVVVDPVCGMTIPGTAPLHRVHEGTTHRFCSEECLAKFEADPDRYLTAPEVA